MIELRYARKTAFARKIDSYASRLKPTGNNVTFPFHTASPSLTEMEKTGETEVAFSCGQRHDELLRLVLPYSRNISAVETMMDAEAARGPMTTGTLGFSAT